MGSKQVIDDELPNEIPKQDDICGDIYNLSGTLYNLMEVDSRILGKDRKARILRMRQIVFDTLEMYIGLLCSDATLDEGEEIPDNRLGDELDED